MKVLIVSDLSLYALGNSYLRAFKKLGYETFTFDLAATEAKYVRLGKVGKKIHTFWPVEAWQKKANRELAVEYRRIMPDMVFVFGNAEIMFGVLAFFKSIYTSKLVLVWPDTLLNLNSFQRESAVLYDAVASYSSSALTPFKKLGFEKTLFVPFAGDIDFLGSQDEINVTFKYDISFAGGWRPEREAALAHLAGMFPLLKMLIKGTGWERFCKNATLLKSCDPAPVYGKAFGDFIRESRINLNVIDDTNYPAANMRFFEIPAAGGLQLSSSCPEMESIFTDREDILFYSTNTELIDQIRWVLENPDNANEVRKSAFKKMEEEHTYSKRIQQLTEELYKL